MTNSFKLALSFKAINSSSIMGLLFLGISAMPGNAADYSYGTDRFEGMYFGVLGQYSYANAEFVWDGTTIVDSGSHNWGVGGVIGYGWKWGSFYFGPEAYFDYANISNSLANQVADVVSLSIDRAVGAGVNLLAGFTGVDDTVLFYGLIGGGATSFSGNIDVVGEGRLTGDIWYPVLIAGGGIDWAVSDNFMLRVQAKHTFYYDASHAIFPSGTSQSYDLDTTTVSVGVVWRPW